MAFSGRVISRGWEAGVKALQPCTRRAKRGIDSGWASATLLQSGECPLGSGITLPSIQAAITVLLPVLQ
jgi:hypothetical protein